MAGGFAKILGASLLVVSLLFILVGAVAAGVGAVVFFDEAEKGAFGDPDKLEVARWGMVGGGAVAGVGLLLLLVGGILRGIGSSQARREVLAAVGAASARPSVPPVAGAARGRRPWLPIAAAVAVVLLVGVLVAAFGGSPGGSGVGAAGLGGGGAAERSFSEAFEGRVQGVQAPILGGYNPQAAAHVLRASGSGTFDLAGNLSWTPAGPGGATTLRLILEVAVGDTWQEVARGEGGPGLVVAASAVEGDGVFKGRIFVGGTGAADQTYALTLTATERS